MLPFPSALLCSKKEESLSDGKIAGMIPDFLLSEGDADFTDAHGEEAARNPDFSTVDVNVEFNDTVGEGSATIPSLATGDCDRDVSKALGETTSNMSIGDSLPNSPTSLTGEDCDTPGDFIEKRGLVTPCNWLLRVFWPADYVVTTFCLICPMLSSASCCCSLLHNMIEEMHYTI